jgi:hypothetical protein
MVRQTIIVAGACGRSYSLHGKWEVEKQRQRGLQGHILVTYFL